MFGLLALLFIVVPIVELYVIVQVAQSIGVLWTIVLVMAVSAIGAWLCKREGLGLFVRIQREIHGGKVPGVSLVDGFLVLFAGALLLTPGFVTDLLGLSLLLPPVRFAVRSVLVRRFARSAQRAVAEGLAGGFGPGGFGPGGFSAGGGRARLFVFDGRMPDGRPGAGRPPANDRLIDVEPADYERKDRPGPSDPPAVDR